MKTTKPISTISFNTFDFLVLKLDDLVKAHILSFWAFITHKPEDDEGGSKEHIHLFCVPSKLLQTDDLKDMFKEFDPQKPDKPRGVLMFHTSKFDDWYLYCLHDSRYLAFKGQSRRFHYSEDEFISSDSDQLLFFARSIDLISMSRFADMESAIKSGISWHEYFSRGTVPLPQVRQFEEAWNLLQQNITFRNGRKGHVDEL